MQQQLKVQLDNVKLPNKTAFFNKIYNISSTVQQSIAQESNNNN
jgi:hypothetical protein